MPRGRRIAAFIAVLTLVVAAGALLGQRSEQDESNAYIDAAQCASCHAAVADSYRLTGMGRSFYRPEHGQHVEDYAQNNVFEHQASQRRYTMLQRGGRYFQRREQTGYDGRPANVLEKSVDYVIGSGNHARTYLHRTERNTLEELPVAWYAENGGYWAMNPGYDRLDHWGFRRQVTYECMFCHNGYPSIPSPNAEAGSEPAFNDPLPEGIDCQRCHGPGQRHAALAREAGADVESIRAAIVNPARLSPDRQMDVCMQCHLETTSAPLPNAIRRYDRGPFSYRPGEPLEAFSLYFDHAPGSGHDDKFEIVNAAYRLRQSACFTESAGALVCTTCHNPHEPSSGDAAAQRYAEACRRCHDPALQQLTAAGEHPQSGDCIDCHMPKRRTEDVIHAVMTDHRIQRFRPAGDLLAPRAERQETEENAYRGPVVPYYPNPYPAKPENELYLAVAQVLDQSNLAEGVQALQSAVERYRPARGEFYLELAEAWRRNGDFDKALPLYQEALRRDPASALVRQKFAAGLRSAGQVEQAADVLRQTPDLRSGSALLQHEFALVRLAQGRSSDAVAAFEGALRLDPEMPEAYNNLGTIWMQRGDGKRAESSFREAIRMRPGYAEAHNNLANLLSARGDLDEAGFHFEKALQAQPDYAGARYNYAVTLTRAQRLEDAKSQLQLALRDDPAVADTHLLLADLLRTEGQLQAAIEHYREALRLRPGFGRAELGLGVALANTGDLAQALSLLRSAASAADGAVRDEALGVLRQLGEQP